MKEYQLLKELKEPSVIYKEDPDDPNNPEVLVKGVGRYRLRQVERNVQEKLADLNKHTARAQSYDDWKQIAWMLDHAAMNEMIRTIVSAKKEIEGRNKNQPKRNRKEPPLFLDKKPRDPFLGRAGPHSKSDI